VAELNGAAMAVGEMAFTRCFAQVGEKKRAEGGVRRQSHLEYVGNHVRVRVGSGGTAAAAHRAAQQRSRGSGARQ
jgi:hypothetical protein